MGGCVFYFLSFSFPPRCQPGNRLFPPPSLPPRAAAVSVMAPQQDNSITTFHGFPIEGNTPVTRRNDFVFSHSAVAFCHAAALLSLRLRFSLRGLLLATSATVRSFTGVAFGFCTIVSWVCDTRDGRFSGKSRRLLVLIYDSKSNGHKVNRRDYLAYLRNIQIEFSSESSFI